jgi:hypothetical protein
MDGFLDLVGRGYFIHYAVDRADSSGSNTVAAPVSIVQA